MIGMIDIRCYLNEFLENYGGHTGYDVRPSERQKGYAIQMLQMAFEYADSLGLTKVMLACDIENDASRKTILKCGRILGKEITYIEEETIQIYWIKVLSK